MAREWRHLTTTGGFLEDVVTISWRSRTPEFATGCEDGSTRAWRLQQNESEEVSMQTVWSAGQPVFAATDAVIIDTVGASAVNRQLLLQRGATDGSALAASSEEDEEDWEEEEDEEEEEDWEEE